MSPTAAKFSWSGAGLQPYHPPSVCAAPMERLQLVQGTYAQGQVVGEKYGTDEVDRVTISGAPTGGTFTISVTLGTGTLRTTGAIAFDAAPAAVQAAVNALVNVAGDCQVSQSGTAYILTLSGPTVGASAITVAATGASLTGGSTPAATASQVTAAASGGAGTYGAYGAGHTDGTQYPTHILAYACDVTSAGVLSFVDTASATAEHGISEHGCPAYYGGTFAVADLVGLDDTAIARLGRLLNRSVFVMYS